MLDDYVSYPCSIGLYGINLMWKVVPEKHFQMPNENHGTRRLTPDRMTVNAFGLCTGAERGLAASSLQVKRSWISDRGSVYPAGVMY